AQRAALSVAAQADESQESAGRDDQRRRAGLLSSRLVGERDARGGIRAAAAASTGAHPRRRAGAARERTGANPQGGGETDLMAELSAHQKKIVERYYERKDEIMLAKLQELVTDLYLAETDKKRASLWDRAAKAMANLKVPQRIADHI